jgi:hypothetical protein
MVAFTIHSARGQNSKTTISFNWGVGTIPEVVGITSGLLDDLVSGTVTSNTTSTGSIGLQIDHNLSPRSSIGLGVAFESISQDIESFTSSQPTTDKYTATYLTIMANGTFAYMNKKYFKLYGRLGIGASFTSESIAYSTPVHDHSVLLAYQISPIGLQAGGKLYFKAELGVGFIGFATIGVGYRF